LLSHKILVYSGFFLGNFDASVVHAGQRADRFNVCGVDGYARYEQNQQPARWEMRARDGGDVLFLLCDSATISGGVLTRSTVV
jgi:hypothetical protein